jgi:hypothetical protein
MTDDDRYEDQELAEARALAAVLERSSPGFSSLDAALRDPDGLTPQINDALDAADMVAASRLPGLAEGGIDRVFQVLQSRIESGRKRARRKLVMLATGGSLAAVAVLMLTVWSPVARRARAPSQSTAEPATAMPKTAGGAARAELESARAELDAAQLAWLNDPRPEVAATLERHLEKYRAAHLEALHRRYAR